MEPDGSLSYSQVPATCPYPQPTPSSPHNPLQLPEDPSKNYPPIYRTSGQHHYIYINYDIFTSSSTNTTTENVAYSAPVLKHRMLFLYNFLVQFKPVTQLYTKLMHMAHCHSDLIPPALNMLCPL
jgi:hypothetical protein